MKRRSGLVSNSSSTSYLVLLKNGGMTEKCPHCGRGGDYSMLDAIDRSSDHDTDMESSEEQLLERIQDAIEKLDGKIKTRQARLWEADQHTKLKSLLERLENTKEERTVAWFRIGYHDLYTQDVFESLKRSGDLEVVEEEFYI